MTATLPEAFRHLEPWSDWAFPTEGERYTKRISVSMDELVSFYTAMKPHMEDLIRYLSRFAWGVALNEQDERLAHLGMTYMEAAVPIDLGWKQPEAVDSYPVSRLEIPERP